jgi:hypothetical protein
VTVPPRGTVIVLALIVVGVQTAAGRDGLAHTMLAPPRTAAIKVMHKGG